MTSEVNTAGGQYHCLKDNVEIHIHTMSERSRISTLPECKQHMIPESITFKGWSYYPILQARKFTKRINFIPLASASQSN